MTYKDTLREAMTMLGSHPDVRFIGYNVTQPGGSAGGTLAAVHESQRIEMPLAESLCASVAVGMSLGGFIPALWIERMDFLPHALDAIVNHLDKLRLLSSGIHKPACIIRTAIGKRRVPLFTGPTHCQDFSVTLQQMVSFPVKKLMWKTSIVREYEAALNAARAGESTMLVEDCDLYETE